MSNKYDGKDLVILTGEDSTLERVAGSRDCSVNVNGSLTEMVQASNCRVYNAGVYGWELQASGLYTIGNSDNLMNHLLAATRLYVGVSVAGTIWTGYGYITSYVTDGTVKGKVTYQLTITGSGPLSTT